MSVLRSTTFQLQVKNEDGTTKMRTFTRAVSDAKETTELLNQELGDNVTVTTKTSRTTQELTQQARLQVTAIEKANKAFQNQAAQLKQQIALAGRSELEQAQLNAQFRLGANATEQQRQEIAQLVAQYHSLTTAQNTVQGSMRNLRGVAQNVGWQVQDIAVQMQMGTNAAIIFSQQGSQIASAFGPAGAALGAFIAVAGAGFPALMTYLNDAKLSTEELEEAQEELNEIFEKGQWTVGDYTDSIRELARVDAQLAELKLFSAMIAAEQTMKSAQEELREYSEEILRFTNLTTDNQYAQGIFEAQLVSIAEKLGLTKDQTILVNNAFREMQESGDVEDFTLLIKDLALNSPKASAELKELALKVSDAAFEAGLAEEQIRRLQELIGSGLSELDAEGFASSDVLDVMDFSWIEDMNKDIEKERKEFEKQVSEFNKLSAELDPFGGALESYQENIERLDWALEQGLISTPEEYTKLSEQLFEDYFDEIDSLFDDSVNKQESNIVRMAGVMSNHVGVYGSVATMMSSVVDTFSTGATEIEAQIENMNGAQQAMFFLQRSLLAAEAFINGVALGTKLAEIYPLAAPAMITAGTTIGATQAGVIAGTTFAGFFDEGGYIGPGQSGIVSEYRDELVNGKLIQGPATVTGGEDTAKLMNAAAQPTNVNIYNLPGQSATVTQNGDGSTDVRIIAKEEAEKVFAQNIDSGVASVMSQKSSKAAKATKANFNIRSSV